MTAAHRTRTLQIVLVGASLLLLGLTLRTVSFGAVWAVLSRLSATDLALLGFANLLVLVTMTGRWWLFLAGQGYRLPYAKLVGYRLAAFGVSYFTPGPHFGGEPLQVYLVTERHDVPADSSIAAVTLDKLFELMANFTFLFVGLLFIIQGQVLQGEMVHTGLTMDSLRNQALLYAFLLLLLPGLLLAALWRGYRPLSGLFLLLMAWRPSARLRAWYDTLRRSEDHAAYLCQERPAILAAALLVSAASWVVLVGEYWLMTQLLGLEISFGQAILALIAARLAILLPMPAGLGALEASQAVALSMLGLDPAAGVGLALLIRGRDVLLGLLGLWIGGASILKMGKTGSRSKESLDVGHAEQAESTAQTIS